MAIWDDVISERDQKILELTGLGAEYGFGERPVLLVVDVIYNFIGDKREPIAESVKRWRYSCGEAGWDALDHMEKLIGACREKEVPIFYTGAERRPDRFDEGIWSLATKRSSEDVDHVGSFGNQIPERIAPRPEDVYFLRNKPSAFHSTPFLEYLIYLGADTVIVTGATTSGCVRATVVDANQFNFRVTMPEECVFDRFELSHKVSLFDLNAKYADVKPTQDVVDYIQTLPQRPFGERTPSRGA